MKIKLNKNKILDADYETELEIGQFNPDFINKKKFVNEYNTGTEFIRIYEINRDNFHVSAVIEMLQVMENVYNEYLKKN